MISLFPSLGRLASIRCRRIVPTDKARMDEIVRVLFIMHVIA